MPKAEADPPPTDRTGGERDERTRRGADKQSDGRDSAPLKDAALGQPSEPSGTATTESV